MRSKEMAGLDQHRYGYQGDFAEMDKETGWNSFELRMYDGVIGRFTTSDPAKQFDSPYVSMGNNPVMGTDPTGGVCVWCVTVPLGAVVGAVSEFAGQVAANKLLHKSWGEAFTDIDYADVFVSGVQGGIAGTGLGAGTVLGLDVAFEFVKASMDYKPFVDAQNGGGFKSIYGGDKSFAHFITDYAAGLVGMSFNGAVSDVVGDLPILDKLLNKTSFSNEAISKLTEITSDAITGLPFSSMFGAVGDLIKGLFDDIETQQNNLNNQPLIDLDSIPIEMKQEVIIITIPQG